MKVDTLLELYELVDELLEEFGEDAPVRIINAITGELEELELAPIEEVIEEGFDPEELGLEEGSGELCIVAYPSGISLDEVGEGEHDGGDPD